MIEPFENIYVLTNQSFSQRKKKIPNLKKCHQIYMFQNIFMEFDGENKEMCEFSLNRSDSAL